MKVQLCYKQERFPNYFYDTDENLIFYTPTKRVPTEYREITIVNGRRLSYYAADPRVIPVNITRGENNNLVANIEGRYLRVDWLVAYSVYGDFPRIVRLIHLDNDPDNYCWDNLKWQSPDLAMAECCKKYGVSNVNRIPEVWKKYIAPRNKSIVYEVSNYGNLKLNGSIVQLGIDTGGYLRTSYQDERTHERVILFVHRVVAESFVKNPNPSQYDIVNHLDGEKKNCREWNLEWTSQSENTNHAILMNLQVGRTNSVETIEAICQDLADSVPVKKICAKYGVSPKFVSKIYTGQRWTSISSKYNFPPRTFTLDQKEEIEKLMDQGKKPREIAEELNIPYSTKFCSLYERIQRHRKWQSENSSK